ncbi:hypothetical protein F9C07_13081 [Aspergillus flavus]|uniref:Glycophorin A domain protein n=1 Tax=Aspergillus flavus (strain ATCC 200026 / FGSC A1120 / IAM 13836 / NRRL 3357 / JCM 12722 / SRRC 167) TaxID=332952 RepID=A0A7G5KJE4_ASPFN|nr:uncharacterized protein G4B84_011453 [Aspergillus flavus NRRL3357]QMW47986.1 hypothetical protein G4B11_011504 [Aspergillus flavus]KAF7629559.1 hypothetical protein AFLA_013273 [Aspergillus flavus NRRL3357]QMW35924.1 hypothetical protein G4B84_011453 [Aspergillus flavus NRRL3357]QRD93135.1 hypothetical protein F9C07_13081 [Aspergillus flavus]RAQ77064.1 hypothetical protein COH20_007394 [Aspergillus flavus]
MVSYDPPYGFPLRRNGSCLTSETSCGKTWGDFYACCPGDSICPGATQSIQNNVCCPTESDCTAPLKATPHCANETGIMYNHTGYFCCLPWQTGFWTDDPDNAVGCSDGSPTARGETILVTKTQSFESTSSTASATTTTSTGSTSTSSIPAATTTSDSDSSNTSHSSNHAGAIAGGVVGGVAGVALIVALLWYFFMRGRKQSQPPAGEGAMPVTSSPQPPLKPLTELEAPKRQYELESRMDQPIHELPTNRY